MQVNLPAGKYVVAVSGGVDSVVLLDVLAKRADVRLSVAHLDHGTRPDAAEDRRHVAGLAKQHGLPFVYHEAKLGNYASEAAARKARYEFLHAVRRASGAEAIITAHHQDDVLETIFLNLLRGTGRRGLSSLRSTKHVKRPLLGMPKQQLQAYALDQGLVWREDSTNVDERYLRNYIRARIVPRFDAPQREQLLDIALKAATINDALDAELRSVLAAQPSGCELDRQAFIMLPHAAAKELMASWLRQQTDAELTRQLIERVVVAANTGRINSRVDINKQHILHIGKSKLALATRER